MLIKSTLLDGTTSTTPIECGSDSPITQIFKRLENDNPIFTLDINFKDGTTLHFWKEEKDS